MLWKKFVLCVELCVEMDHIVNKFQIYKRRLCIGFSLHTSQSPHYKYHPFTNIIIKKNRTHQTRVNIATHQMRFTSSFKSSKEILEINSPYVYNLSVSTTALYIGYINLEEKTSSFTLYGFYLCIEFHYYFLSNANEFTCSITVYWIDQTQTIKIFKLGVRE